MTPAATTPAGRIGAAKQAPAAKPAPGHRRGLRPQPAPRSPRRVSGPAQGRVSAPPRFAPRRGPDRPLGARALAFARALPDHALLDRIIRGRSWIPILGVMLAGIVAMQVEVLKLGANMGRSIELGTSLQSRNELLRNSVATLADDQRIERLAAKMGMVMPAPDGVGFLSPAAPNVRQALAHIRSPNPSGFLSLLSANGTVTPAAPVAAPTGASPSLASPGSGTPGAQGASSVATATGAAGSTPATATAAPPSSGQASGPAAGQAPSTAPNQAASAAGGAAATQVAPTQTPSSQAAPATGGAGVPTGG